MFQTENSFLRTEMARSLDLIKKVNKGRITRNHESSSSNDFYIRSPVGLVCDKRPPSSFQERKKSLKYQYHYLPIDLCDQ